MRIPSFRLLITFNLESEGGEVGENQQNVVSDIQSDPDSGAVGTSITEDVDTEAFLLEVGSGASSP